MVLEVGFDVTSQANRRDAKLLELVQSSDGVGRTPALGDNEYEIVLAQVVLTVDECRWGDDLHLAAEILHHEVAGTL